MKSFPTGLFKYIPNLVHPYTDQKKRDPTKIINFGEYLISLLASAYNKNINSYSDTKVTSHLKIRAKEIPLLNSPSPSKPSIQFNTNTKNAATIAISAIKIAQVSNAESAASQTSLKVATALLPKAIKNISLGLPGIPFFLWLLYTSKEKYADNINVNIPAPVDKKIYRVTLEKGSTAISTTFEIAAGKPIRLLKNGSGKAHEHVEPLNLYNAESSSLKKSMLGPLSVFEWKRKEHYAILNINIRESLKNDSLKKGPRTYCFPLSDKEFIRINHLPNSTTNKKQPSTKQLSSIDGSDWILRKITINLPATDSITKQVHHIPLPGIALSRSSCKEFLHIEQL